MAYEELNFAVDDLATVIATFVSRITEALYLEQLKKTIKEARISLTVHP